jgi:hypothetical protein
LETVFRTCLSALGTDPAIEAWYHPSIATANQSHCGCRTEHDPEFFGPEPTSRKKGRQERRGSSERSEKCGVEHHKSKQYAAVGGHDLQVHRSGAHQRAFKAFRKCAVCDRIKSRRPGGQIFDGAELPVASMN